METFEELVDEIYNQVSHLEPFVPGTANEPSTAACILFRVSSTRGFPRAASAVGWRLVWRTPLSIACRRHRQVSLTWVSLLRRRCFACASQEPR